MGEELQFMFNGEWRHFQAVSQYDSVDFFKDKTYRLKPKLVESIKVAMVAYYNVVWHISAGFYKSIEDFKDKNPVYERMPLIYAPKLDHNGFLIIPEEHLHLR